ncbi:ABC transporter substrate-binding protein [Brachybacterium sp.]|uniref:ABC transporter substrate-binding protein n=1 Tax=Brachybacterium sp. TaxID=1891286 RepID=UPI003F8DD783
MKRRHFTFALAATTGAMLTACSGDGGGASGDFALPEDREISAKLNYGIWDNVQQPAMEEIIDAFNEEYPNIEVSITTAPFDQYFTRLQTQAGSGEMPDVLWMNGPNVQLYASEGMLMPLSELLEAGDIDPGNYPGAMNELYTMEGEQYAVPKDFDTIGLWYNKRLFDEAGVEYPSDGWTWDDFRSAAKTISDELGDQGVYGFAGGVANQALVYPAIMQAGGEIISEDGTTSGYDSSEARQAFQMLADMVEDGSSPSVATTTDTEYYELFSSERAAMAWDGNWRVATYADSPAMENIQVTHLPREQRQATPIHGIGNAVAANTSEPEAAAAFLAFLGGEQAAIIQAEMGTANPAFTGSQDAYIASVPEFDLQVFIDAAEEYAIQYPVSLNTAAWLNEESEYFPALISGEMTVDEGTSALAEAMNAHLEAEQG